MIRKYGFSISALVFFGIGVAVWKHFSNPLPVVDSLADSEESASSATGGGTNLPELTVGSQTITPDDLQWELDLHTVAPLRVNNPLDTKELDPIALAKEPSTELRDRVISAVLERKIAYLYITENAKNFDPSDPSRFTKCLSLVAE